jgi:hypothetical protein
MRCQLAERLRLYILRKFSRPLIPHQKRPLIRLAQRVLRLGLENDLNSGTLSGEAPQGWTGRYDEE